MKVRLFREVANKQTDKQTDRRRLEHNMLNCLVLSGLIVSEGLRKRSTNVTIFFLQNFNLNSIAYIYLLVKFLFSLFFCFLFMFICYQLW